MKVKCVGLQGPEANDWAELLDLEGELVIQNRVAQFEHLVVAVCRRKEVGNQITLGTIFGNRLTFEKLPD